MIAWRRWFSYRGPLKSARLDLVCTKTFRVKNCKNQIGPIRVKTGCLILVGLQTGRQVIRRAYWQDGKNYRSIRRRCHRRVCADLRRDGPEDQTGAQITRHTA